MATWEDARGRCRLSGWREEPGTQGCLRRSARLLLAGRASAPTFAHPALVSQVSVMPPRVDLVSFVDLPSTPGT